MTFQTTVFHVREGRNGHYHAVAYSERAQNWMPLCMPDRVIPPAGEIMEDGAYRRVDCTRCLEALRRGAY